MSEKLLADFVAVVAIAPLCALCVLGPAVIASIFAGAAAWFGGFDTVVTVGPALVVGVAAFTVVRNRKVPLATAKRGGEMNQ